MIKTSSMAKSGLDLKPFILMILLALVAVALNTVSFTAPQIISTLVFMGILFGTLFYWKFRLTFAFGGLFVLLAAHLIDIDHIVQFAGLDVILFLVGMMILIGYMEEKHFFEYLIAKVDDAIGHRPYLLVSTLMFLSALFSALVGEVTAILFMLSTTFHLTKRYKVNPVPFLLMLVFAANIGSSSTAVGNPIGVMIALRAHFTVTDFLRWAAPMSLVALALTIGMCLVMFRKTIHELAERMKAERKEVSEAVHVAHKKEDIRRCWALFIGTIALLIFHAELEHILGLEKNTLLIGISLAAGAVGILLMADDAPDFFTRRVDWWTLTFFMALFASVGTLKYVGVTERIADGMILLGHGDSNILLIAFTSAISLLTGFMDNVLAVATFIPILGEIGKAGVYIFPFWWAMLFGGTMYGNLTVVGSTANIVAMGMLEKEYQKHITFFEWLGPGFLVSTVTVVSAVVLLMMQFPLMPR